MTAGVVELPQSPLPKRPLDVDDVARIFPMLRQSLLSTFDNCPLSCLFELKYANGWSTHPQARGTLFHRFAAEALRTMREAGENSIPVSEALEILYEVVRQEGVPLEDRVRVSLRDLRELRISAIKWAADNSFTVSAIVDIERRLYATVVYPHPETGVAVERTITGTPDVLIARGEDEVIVIDWKDTWALPPERVAPPSEEEAGLGDDQHVSYEGYFQQRFYALLVMREFPMVNRVTLREFYPRKTQVREATVGRGQLEHIEREFAALVEAFDATVAAGTAVRPWRPQPGKHCAFCATPQRCPIDDRARKEGMVRNEPHARKVAGELAVAERIRTHHREALRAWVTVHGPVELKNAKGRSEVGFKPTKTKVRLKSGETVVRRGQEFGIHTPADSDRATSDPSDERLREALEQSVDEARVAREKAKRARRSRGVA